MQQQIELLEQFNFVNYYHFTQQEIDYFLNGYILTKDLIKKKRDSNKIFLFGITLSIRFLNFYNKLKFKSIFIVSSIVPKWFFGKLLIGKLYNRIITLF